MDATKGFLNFTDWNNPDDKSSKPFKDDKDNDFINRIMIHLH